MKVVCREYQESTVGFVVDGWAAAKRNSEEGNLEGYTLCFLVGKVDDLAADQSSRHFIEASNIGTHFRGDVTVFLQMFLRIRAEWSCTLAELVNDTLIVNVNN